MSSEGYETIREGYLDVKIPLGQSERFLNKGWWRVWVRVIVFRSSGRGEPHLIIQLIRKAGTVGRTVKAPRDGLRLFRCRSRSRPFKTWSLSSGDTLLLYLAAGNEIETQRWMRDVRNGLWVPILSQNMMNDAEHEVSIIDDDKSFSCGLLGVYGYLVHRPDESVICLVHPHWLGTQMRWKVEDIIQVKLIRLVENSVGVFSLQVRRIDEIRTIQFYTESPTKTVHWLQSLISLQHNNGPEKNSNYFETGHRNSIKVIDCSRLEAVNSYNPKNRARNSLPNIPGDFFNASENSLSSQRISNCMGHDDDGELYDNIYEEIHEVREDRAFTDYEEIDDDDDGQNELFLPSVPELRTPDVLKSTSLCIDSMANDLTPQRVPSIKGKEMKEEDQNQLLPPPIPELKTPNVSKSTSLSIDSTANDLTAQKVPSITAKNIKEGQNQCLPPPISVLRIQNTFNLVPFHTDLTAKNLTTQSIQDKEDIKEIGDKSHFTTQSSIPNSDDNLSLSFHDKNDFEEQTMRLQKLGESVAQALEEAERSDYKLPNSTDPQGNSFTNSVGKHLVLTKKLDLGTLYFNTNDLLRRVQSRASKECAKKSNSF